MRNYLEQTPAEKELDDIFGVSLAQRERIKLLAEYERWYDFCIRAGHEEITENLPDPNELKDLVFEEKATVRREA